MKFSELIDGSMFKNTSHPFKSTDDGWISITVSRPAPLA